MTDGTQQYVLKHIHHEPCDYYTFSDKLASELRDYECNGYMEQWDFEHWGFQYWEKTDAFLFAFAK